MIVRRIRESILPGTVIPKPEAESEFTVKAWGRRRGQAALVYYIPNHSKPGKPYEKGVTEAELESAFLELTASGQFTRTWFNAHLAACANEGGCNFTTIGGIFKLLGEAEYSERGVYERLRK